MSPCQPASQPACLLTVWRLCLCLTHTHTRRHVVEAMSAGRFHSFVRAQHQKHPSCKQSMAGIDRLGCRCSKLNALGLCAARCAHPMLLRFGSEKPEAPAVPSFGLRALRQFSSEPNPYEAMNPDPETLNLNHPARTVVSFCLEGSRCITALQKDLKSLLVLHMYTTNIKKCNYIYVCIYTYKNTRMHIYIYIHIYYIYVYIYIYIHIHNYNIHIYIDTYMKPSRSLRLGARFQKLGPSASRESALWPEFTLPRL